MCPDPCPHGECAGRVSQTQACTRMSPLALHPQRHTQLPAGKGTKHTHTHTHKCVLREISLSAYTAPPPPPLPPWGQLPSGTCAVALDSRVEGLSACSSHCQSLSPLLPTRPTAQTASWRNKCLWMARASPTPETPARNASAGKAMPTANLGPAPGPPVPTRCLVPVARTTATVRRTGWGVVPRDGLAPSIGL